MSAPTDTNPTTTNEPMANQQTCAGDCDEPAVVPTAGGPMCRECARDLAHDETEAGE